jgi:Na+/phosphate symporter
MKKSLYALAWIGLIALDQVNATSNNFGGGNTTPDVVTKSWMSTNPADVAIQNIISYVIGFLYLIAVIYWLWWGFNILTASWDEEKVKNWKKVIINALIWIVVIFLVNSIVKLIFNTITTSGA